MSAPDDPYRSRDSLFLQQAREQWKRDKGARIHYTKKFDLTRLPSYEPEEVASGIIRQWGVNYLADSGLVDRWQQEFSIYHPQVEFETRLKSSMLAAPGLYTNRADLAPSGRQLTWAELTAYQRETESLPLEITFATGSYDVGGWTAALAIMVHRDNPIRQLTLGQLDGIFGARRSGAWRGLVWDGSAARGPGHDVRTWGQLGLDGDWADRPIHVYGYTLKYDFADRFARAVFGGGDKWNESLDEYANKPTPDGNGLILAADQFMARLDDDPCGIAYGGVQSLTAKTRVADLAVSSSGPYVELTLDNVQNRSYPLIGDVFYYAPRNPQGQLDPNAREFLRYVLSREGQDLIQADGKYLPLTAEAAAGQLAKL